MSRGNFTQGYCVKKEREVSCLRDEPFLRISGGNDLFADEMEAENLRRLAFVKVALYGVADLRPQFFQGIRLGEDGFAKSARGESAFRRLFDEKNQFVHFD